MDGGLYTKLDRFDVFSYVHIMSKYETICQECGYAAPTFVIGNKSTVKPNALVMTKTCKAWGSGKYTGCKHLEEAMDA